VFALPAAWARGIAGAVPDDDRSWRITAATVELMNGAGS